MHQLVLLHTRRIVLAALTALSFHAAQAQCVTIAITTPADTSRICANSYRDYVATPGYDKYLWYRNNTPIAGTSGNVFPVSLSTVNNVPSGQIQVRGIRTGATPCSTAQAAAAYAFKPAPPNDSPTPRLGTLTCGAGPVTITNPVANGDYRWSNGMTGASITITRGGLYSPMLFVNGCPTSTTYNTAKAPFSGEPTPQPIAVTAGNIPLCVGTSATLSGPAGASGYKWTTGATTRTIDVSQAGDYGLQLRSAGGCFSDTATMLSGVRITPYNATADDTITIIVNTNLTYPRPGFTINTQSFSLQNTSELRLYSGITIGTGRWLNIVDPRDDAQEPLTRFTSIGNGIWIKKFRPRDYYNIPVGTSIEALNFVLVGGPQTSTWYGREGKNMEAPYDATANNDFIVPFPLTGRITGIAKPLHVEVLPTPPTPTITASGPTQICEGSTVTLTSSQPFHNRWSTGDTTRSIVVDTAGSFTVWQLNATCNSPASTPVVVTVTSAPPAPGLATSGPTTFCQGDSVRLTAAASGSIRWSTGDTTLSILVRSSGQYTVQTVTPGCSSAVSSVQVVVRPTPEAPMVDVIGPTGFCTGDSVILSSSAVVGNRWSNGDTTASIVVRTTGIYTVYRIVDGCRSPESQFINVFATDRPNVGLALTNDTLRITAPSAGAQYSWMLDSTALLGVFGESYVPTRTGWYQVVGSNGACRDTSDATFVTVVSTRPSRASAFTVAPNPFGSAVTIYTRSASPVEVIDARGLTVFRLDSDRPLEGVRLDLAHLPPGLYLVRHRGQAQRLLKQ